MQNISKGNIVVGKVSSIKQYGFFVQIDEKISGLVHISEISDKYVTSISKFVSVGEKILVKIKDVKNENLVLSIKDINYKTKKSCIELAKPTLKINNQSFEIFNLKFSEWYHEWERSDGKVNLN